MAERGLYFTAEEKGLYISRGEVGAMVQYTEPGGRGQQCSGELSEEMARAAGIALRWLVRNRQTLPHPVRIPIGLGEDFVLYASVDRTAMRVRVEQIGRQTRFGVPFSPQEAEEIARVLVGAPRGE